jgi:preprotein translocase YajC subunit
VNHLLALGPALLAATTKKTTSSGSVTFLIFIVVIVGALYFLFLRPNQQKARRQREENASINVGDRVVSIGGIVGTVEEMQNDRVVLVSGNTEGDGIQPTRLVLLRSAIARKVDAGSAPSTDDEPTHDHDDDEQDSAPAEDTGKADGDTRE